jgi:cell division protein FtsB
MDEYDTALKANPVELAREIERLRAANRELKDERLRLREELRKLRDAAHAAFVE